MKVRQPITVIAPVGVMIAVGVPGCKKAQDYYNQGRSHIRKKEYDLAISNFTKAIEKNPRLAGAYYNRGLVYLYHHDRDNDKAISDFTKAIEINPKLGFAYTERAMAYLMKQEYDQARADVQKAESLGVEMNPGFLDAVRKGPERKRESGADAGSARRRFDAYPDPGCTCDRVLERLTCSEDSSARVPDRRTTTPNNPPSRISLPSFPNPEKSRLAG